MRAILFKDGIEVRRAEYPDLKMKAIDLPIGYEWKLIVEGERPDYNELETIERSEVDNGNSHIDYPHLKVIEVTHTAIKKADADIIQMIKGRENNANESLIGHTDRLKFMFLYMALVHRKLNGLNITAKMQLILDKGDAKAVKLWKNDTTLKAKLKDVTDGINPNLKTGWTNE